MKLIETRLMFIIGPGTYLSRPKKYPAQFNDFIRPLTGAGYNLAHGQWSGLTTLFPGATDHSCKASECAHLEMEQALINMKVFGQLRKFGFYFRNGFLSSQHQAIASCLPFSCCG